MNILKAIWRGMWYLEGYGHHPGTAWLIVLIIGGALSGLNNGIVGVLIGAGAMLIIFGSMYLAGAYDRGKHTLQKKNE